MIASRLDTTVVPVSRLDEWVGQRNVLGILGFGSPVGETGAVPRVDIDFGPHGDRGLAEVWTSNAPVQTTRAGDLILAHDDDTMMGCIRVTADGDRLTETTHAAYRAIFASCDQLGFPHLQRMWNFIPDINGTCRDGLERYRAFCIGRARAFFDDRHIRETHLPAGTGVGCRGEHTAVAFLASRHANHINLENPRQVPAYHYPARYGPKSPSFARGTLVDYGEGADIYVSGTSSIVGHETVHHGLVDRQLDETLVNIDCLLARESLAVYDRDEHATSRDLDHVKVFVRHAKDMDRVRARLADHLRPEAEVVYLGADICRADLLIEIEGVIHTDRR